MAAFESKYADYQGVINASAVQELGTGAIAPTTIVRADQPWRIHIDWTVSGLAVATQAGKWRVSAYLESIGPGADLKLPNVSGPNEVTMPLVYGQTNYHCHINVAANEVPVDPERSRAYKLVIAISYTKPDDTPGPMVGFVDGDVLQFYKA